MELEEPVRLCVELDLRVDGSFGREWLVVTQDRLIIFSENGERTYQRFELPLSDVKNPKVRNLVGGGALEVARNGSRLELVRYTNARAPHFTSTANVLEKWLKNEEAEFFVEEEAHCSRCGLPLEKGTKVCPACTPKSQTLMRLLGYMKPYWKSAIALSVVAIVNTALGLVPPYLQKPLIDRVLAPAGTFVRHVLAGERTAGCASQFARCSFFATQPVRTAGHNGGKCTYCRQSSSPD